MRNPQAGIMLPAAMIAESGVVIQALNTQAVKKLEKSGTKLNTADGMKTAT